VHNIIEWPFDREKYCMIYSRFIILFSTVYNNMVYIILSPCGRSMYLYIIPTTHHIILSCDWNDISARIAILTLLYCFINYSITRYTDKKTKNSSTERPTYIYRICRKIVLSEARRRVFFTPHTRAFTAGKIGFTSYSHYSSDSLWVSRIHDIIVIYR